MRAICGALVAVTLCSVAASAQNTFVITGTAIPADLLTHSYGKLPKTVVGYDLNICNVSTAKQSLVSSEVLQALAQSNPGLQPIGRQIMLSEILRSQNRSVASITTLALNSLTTVFSILSSARYNTPSGLVTAAGLGSVSAQQILATLKPVLTADQLERFENEVLQSALVLDAGSCTERTVFALALAPAAKAKPLSFHLR
jgi:hypothetical protein